MMDYYEVLEVSPNASDEVLKRAYYALVQKYHPDQYHSNAKQFATRRAQQINEAYRVLSDPTERRRYDAKLGQQTRIASSHRPTPVGSLLKIATLAILVVLGFRFMGVFARLLATSTVFKVLVPVLVLAILFWFFKKRAKQHTKL